MIKEELKNLATTYGLQQLQKTLNELVYEAFNTSNTTTIGNGTIIVNCDYSSTRGNSESTSNLS